MSNACSCCRAPCCGQAPEACSSLLRWRCRRWFHRDCLPSAISSSISNFKSACQVQATAFQCIKHKAIIVTHTLHIPYNTDPTPQTLPLDISQLLPPFLLFRNLFRQNNNYICFLDTDCALGHAALNTCDKNARILIDSCPSPMVKSDSKQSRCTYTHIQAHAQTNTQVRCWLFLGAPSSSGH